MPRKGSGNWWWGNEQRIDPLIEDCSHHRNHGSNSIEKYFQCTAAAQLLTTRVDWWLELDLTSHRLRQQHISVCYVAIAFWLSPSSEPLSLSCSHILGTIGSGVADGMVWCFLFQGPIGSREWVLRKGPSDYWLFMMAISSGLCSGSISRMEVKFRLSSQRCIRAVCHCMRLRDSPIGKFDTWLLTLQSKRVRWACSEASEGFKVAKSTEETLTRPKKVGFQVYTCNVLFVWKNEYNHMMC